MHFWRQWKIESWKSGERTVMSVRLTKGKYKGLLYNYGVVRLIQEDGLLRLQFELIPVEYGKNGFDADDPILRKTAGDILRELLTHPEKYGEIVNMPINEENEDAS